MQKRYRKESRSWTTEWELLFSDKIRNGRNISVPEIAEVCSESDFECYIDGLPAHEVYPEDFEEPTPPEEPEEPQGGE